MLAIALLLAFAAWGWWLDHRAGSSNQPTITIGSKDGSEMIILGHMLADLVEADTPLQVDRRFNLGGTLVCYNALRLGGLDAYVEYTGTALTTILKEPVQTDPAAVLERVRTELKPPRPGRLPRPVRLREHVRPADAARPGRAAGTSGRSPI